MSPQSPVNPQNTLVKTNTFELLSEVNTHTPASTTYILSNFATDPLPDLRDVTAQRQSNLRKHAETVEELQKWHKLHERNTSVKFPLRSILWKSAKVRLPSKQDLYSSIDHFFPQRLKMKVIICDFGEGRAERNEVYLGNIEREFHRKPSWATVRWIHAPLGIGLLHSSVEHLFFHSGSSVKGRPFSRAGRAGWPFLETETLDFRSKKYIEDSRDLMRILRTDKETSYNLDRSIFVDNNNERLRRDLIWRAGHMGKALGFWDLAMADLPWQISEGSNLNMNGPTKGIRTTKLTTSPQSLTRHAFFKDAYLARNPFRCFHRNDGFLLTMSPAAGVDYLNANLPEYLQMSREDLSRDNFASAMAQIYMEFADTGTSTWYRKNVEWFLVYLMTEVGTTPHSIRQGYSVPSLMDAYDAIIHEMKERRYDQWQRNETINLVRAYLLCLDELTVMEEIFTEKLDFFRRLKQDCDNFELQDNAIGKPPDNQDGVNLSDRVTFAENMMENSSRQCHRLNADLRESLNTLFQLRSIEQNELAIIADKKNKAIFVFTAITIVFLPLSFFTSYFGMNIEGISENDWTQMHFWKVCGSSSLGIIIMVCLYAFRLDILKYLDVS